MIQSSEVKRIIMKTAVDCLCFDAASGRLISFKAKAAPEQEFIASAEEHSVFVIQYLDEDREYQELDSLSAEDVQISCSEAAEEKTLLMEFRRIGGLDLHVTAKVQASRRKSLSRWSLSVRNGAGLELVSVQFPFIVVAYEPAGKPDEEALLLPRREGELLRDLHPDKLGPDYPGKWEMTPANGDTGHYPGSFFAQFMAYYNRHAGLYLACEDTEGYVKLFNALHRDPGIRLGIAHVGDWPQNGQRQLEYDVVLSSFTGDWYAAAEIYRNWSLKQKWATPLHQRKDVPEWLLDSPPHITLRMQGQLDRGPTFPVDKFLPYSKTIPLLEKIAGRVEAPLAIIITSWERGGPWVYPDCFPPVGGDESIAEFAAMARERGWHAGSLCNGTRWVLSHSWSRYDGRKYFKENEGYKGVCHTHDARMWKENWDTDWRHSYACCLGTLNTRSIAIDFVKRLLRWGLESIQFFDQNINAATFPCFSADHDHPPVPGKWMTERMEQIVGEFNKAAVDAGEGAVIQSVECPCNEYCLPLFQQCDTRVSPPGHGTYVPLYHFIFHECIVIHGMMGNGPEPYHLPTRNAYNCVLGGIPGAVMKGDGSLLNKDTQNWAPWDPPVGSNEDALDMLRTTTALRRGPGRDFLVFGRMQRPAEVERIEIMEWENKNQIYHIPAVFHSAWVAPDGRFGIVLANWTTEAQTVTISDVRLGDEVNIHICGVKQECQVNSSTNSRVKVTVPRLSCMLVEPNSEK